MFVFSFILLYITEGTCVTCCISLPPLLSQAYLVKFSNTWRPLPCQSTVYLGCYTCINKLHTCLFILDTCFRIIHAFTCAGILQSQFRKFTEFSGLGTVGNRSIRRGFVLYLFICITICVHVYVVYASGGYMEIIQRAAESSMQAAVSEVKCLPQYLDNGEVG